jgi:hypothetical protein
MINLVKGDIFNAPNTFSFAQCVSKDSHQGMFREIAVEFLKRFPALKVLRGKVLVEGKIIYNLVSKPTFWYKPKIGCLRACIVSVHDHANQSIYLDETGHVKAFYIRIFLHRIHASGWGIEDIAVPLLGSGLDKLDFAAAVYPILENVFGGSKVHLHIYHQGRHGINRFDLVYLYFDGTFHFIIYIFS